MSKRVDRLFTPPADLPLPRWTHWVGLAVVTAVGLPAVPVLAVFLGAGNGTQPPLAILGAAVAIVEIVLGVTFTYAVWRYRLEILAWTPGPIAVLPFTDERRKADRALAARLTASFEQHLAQTKIYGATAVPAAGRPSDFLQVVEEAGDRMQGVWGAVSRFARILAPVSAFRVSCSLAGDRGTKPCVLLVELTRLTRTSIAPMVIEDDSWDIAVERAAHAVAARVLPRTSQCRNPPWTPWENLRLPVALFESYQRFLAARGDRRFDDALAELREAIRRDPTNAALRLDLGKLQERLQLYLDALLTYDNLITNAARRDPKLARWWLPGDGAKGPDAWSDPRRARGLRPDDPVVLVARYRHALMLGLSGRLVRQWWLIDELCPAGHHLTAREERRAHLRKALRERLAARHPAFATLDRPCLADLTPKSGPNERHARAAEARILFTTLGQLEFEYLVRDYVKLHPLEHVHASWERARRRSDAYARWAAVVRSGSPAPRPAPARGHLHVRLARVLPREALLLGLPWACLRRAMAVSWAADTQGSDRATVDPGLGRSIRAPHSEVFEGAECLVAGGWPVPIDRLERVVLAVTGSPEAGLRSWRAHFNGACVLALPLLSSDAFTSSVIDPDPVAKASVAELGRAVACADGGFLAQQRDWLLSEDPDLSQLRGRSEFRHFEARTFGSISAAVSRGPDIHQWEQSTYVAAFISAAAGAMAAVWRERPGTDASPADAARWLEEEMAGWFLAERLALDSADPRTRADVSRRIAQLRIPSVSHPRFSEAVLDQQLATMTGKAQIEMLPIPHSGGSRQVSERVSEAIKMSDKRLANLSSVLREPTRQSGPACCALAWASVFREEERRRARDVESWSRDLDRSALAAWCRASEKRWSTLSSWFDDTTYIGLTLDRRRGEFVKALPKRWRLRVAAPGRRGGRSR